MGGGVGRCIREKSVVSFGGHLHFVLIGGRGVKI